MTSNRMLTNTQIPRTNSVTVENAEENRAVIPVQLMYVSWYLCQAISSKVQLHQTRELQHGQWETAEIVA